MMEGYKVSVIMAAFNAAEYIADAIGSVLAQTYPDFEIVVVNDGSSDQTEDILRSYVQKHPNMIFETISHSGVCFSRNRAIEISTGDYLFFLDADDFIHPQLLERMIFAVQQTGAMMASELFCQVNINASHTMIHNLPPREKEINYSYRSHQETRDDLFCNSALNMIGGLLIKKRIAQEVKFDERFIIGEDKLFLYQSVLAGADYAAIHKKWYYNRIHKTNSSYNHSREAFLSRYMRRKYFWINEFVSGKHEHAIQEINEAFSILLDHYKHNKTREEFALISRLIRRDRKYFYRLKNPKIRLFVFCISHLNPMLFSKKTTSALEIWKNTGLY